MIQICVVSTYTFCYKDISTLSQEQKLMKQYTFNDIKKQIEQWIETDVILPEDIPSIELYMDQVTTFMDKQLSGTKRHDDDKILTKTMINNYSKNDLLPPSDKKKYSKDHIILLMYILASNRSIRISVTRLLSIMSDSLKERDVALYSTPGVEPS